MGEISMNYAEAEEYINQIPRFSKVKSEENVDEILALFGHPEKKFAYIHVAGTNGKGSTLAFLAGIFAGAGYSVESNREHGEGRSDIVIYNDVTGQVAVFEAKYSRKLEDLEKDCQKALDQINTKMYAKEFEDAYEQVLCYGIPLYKKRCLVKSK